MKIGKEIDICFEDDKTLIKHKSEMVKGIQSFVCNLSPETRNCRCVMFELDGLAVVKQREFAAELVKQGFDVIWERYGSATTWETLPAFESAGPVIPRRPLPFKSQIRYT